MGLGRAGQVTWCTAGVSRARYDGVDLGQPSGRCATASDCRRWPAAVECTAAARELAATGICETVWCCQHTESRVQPHVTGILQQSHSCQACWARQISSHVIQTMCDLHSRHPARLPPCQQAPLHQAMLSALLQECRPHTRPALQCWIRCLQAPRLRGCCRAELCQLSMELPGETDCSGASGTRPRTLVVG